MNQFRRILGVGALVALCTTSGYASSLSWWVDMFGLGPAQQTPIALSGATAANPNTSNSVSMPKFDQTDPNPGHYYALTSVQMALSWEIDGTFQTVNLYSSPINFFNGYSDINLTVYANDPLNTQVAATATAGPVSGTANCCFTVTSFPGQSGTGNNSQFAADLTYFEGFGNLSFSPSITSGAFAATGQSTDPHAGGNLFYGGSGTTKSVLEVTYTYGEFADLATPEPMTSLLVGGALFGLGVLVRKQRARKA